MYMTTVILQSCEQFSFVPSPTQTHKDGYFCVDNSDTHPDPHATFLRTFQTRFQSTYMQERQQRIATLRFCGQLRK